MFVSGIYLVPIFILGSMQCDKYWHVISGREAGLREKKLLSKLHSHTAVWSITFNMTLASACVGRHADMCGGNFEILSIVKPETTL